MPVGCSVPVGMFVIEECESLLKEKSPMPVGCSVPVGSAIGWRKAYRQDGHQCLSAVRSLLGFMSFPEVCPIVASPMPVGCSVPVGLI